MKFNRKIPTTFLCAAWFLALHAQTLTLDNEYYSIRLGAFSKAIPQDFEPLKPYGYLYAERASATLQRVIIGVFDKKDEANTVLEAAKTAGYKDAFISIHYTNKSKQYFLQVGSFPTNAILWQQFTTLKMPLKAYFTNGQLKVLVGPYKDLPAINTALQSVRSQGFSEAFIKYISRELLHDVSDFEKAFYPAPALPPAPEVPQNDNPPPTPEPSEPKNEAPDGAQTTPTKTSTALSIKPTAEPIQYVIFGNGNDRASVLELQNELAQNRALNTLPTGIFDINTSRALENFSEQNNIYKRSKALTELAFYAFEQKDVAQRGIDLIRQNPLAAIQALKTEATPLAKAYIAYTYFTGKAQAPTTDPVQEVNRLMKEAIDATFSDNDFRGTVKFDYTAQYDYRNNLQLLLQHIGFLHNAADNLEPIPCWLLEKHPEFAADLLSNLDIALTADCGDFMSWAELKIVKTLSEGLDTSWPAVQNTQTIDIQNAYRAERTKLYLIPQSYSLDDLEMFAVWQQRLIAGLEAKANKPSEVSAFKVAYYNALVQLENHYISRGFEVKSANLLAIAVMRTVVNYHLTAYLN